MFLLAITISVSTSVFRGCFNPIFLRFTNDGNTTLREIDVAHPAAKNSVGHRTNGARWNDKRHHSRFADFSFFSHIVADFRSQLERSSRNNDPGSNGVSIPS